ncbi:protein phosphatase CheZ [Thalassospira sp. ER-Se-21-Dark]|uniref:protein phosphatase CheZ n=1 Tax=Thalassospira sp. ER-Se-21-Dark TaxID=2585190 RepID=UPI001B308723|nr:protein phosphatase CheZ [Thalassospira sp. ER-Se-21-Dark]MBP3125009.1 protein phosphatase CheZ [Thalassospira sp. ER-Se-21-Dark]
MSRRVQKVFTAERRLKERTGGVVEDWSDSFFDPTLESGMGAGEPMQASLPAATSAPETSGITQAVLDEIRALRGEVSQLRQAVASGGVPASDVTTPFASNDAPMDELPEPVSSNPTHSNRPGAAEPDRDDLELIRTQIAEMNEHIHRAKVQIASLRHPKAQDDRLVSATSELDAIVKDTEMATHTILESAEQIDDLTMTLKNSAPSDFVADHVEQIAFIVTKIFEACNFQDITGQRINKVVSTLEFVEERVHNMISIWGEDAFAELPVPEVEEESRPEDADLLNGPQLEGEGISQDDIDKLFE